MPPPDTSKITPSASARDVVSQVRAAAISDVPQIHELLDAYAQLGNVLPRPFSELYRHLRDFFVVEVDHKIAACGALEIFTEDLGEVRSLVVGKDYTGHGLGNQLVQRIVSEAKIIGLRRVMALTYVPEFFHKMNFRTVPKDTLPEKIWGICVKCYKFNNCDETAVLLDL